MAGNDFLIMENRRPHTEYIKRQITDQTEQGIDDPLAVVDIDEVVERYRKWNQLFRRVELFYALKCNNDEKIVDVLVQLGSSFDCASKGEIQQVLGLGVDPSRIIYANPCKQNSHLIYAKEHNVDLMTFETEEELIKMKMLYGSARLLIRFRTKNVHAMYNLGEKFGCEFKEVMNLFKSAKSKSLNIIGVCFHVGSNCLSSEAYAFAIKDARRIFDMGRKVGFDMNVLDIGGGYRGRDVDHPTIEENADVINKCLDEYFPEAEGVKIIAEPGRYLVETAVSAAACIIGRKFIYDNGIGHVMYNINDGIYGTFHRLKDEPKMFVISSVFEKAKTETYSSTVWGPTCANTDCLATDIPLPLMEVGEWVYMRYSGAYTFRHRYKVWWILEFELEQRSSDITAKLELLPD